jgi:hypothetical protein
MRSHTSTTLAAAALTLIVGAPRANATWLQCNARTADASGGTGYFTTVVGVGAVNPARLARLRQRLADYVTRTDPDAHAPQVHCVTFEDQLQATSYYSKTLGVMAQRLGWDHVVVVSPAAWLTDSEIVEDPARP